MTFNESMRRVEAALIRRALRNANGSVTTASRLLGFKHHQSLTSLIDRYHPELRELMPERKRRRKSYTQPSLAPARIRRHGGNATTGLWHKEAL